MSLGPSFRIQFEPGFVINFGEEFCRFGLKLRCMIRISEGCVPHRVRNGYANVRITHRRIQKMTVTFHREVIEGIQKYHLIRLSLTNSLHFFNFFNDHQIRGYKRFFNTSKMNDVCMIRIFCWCVPHGVHRYASTQYAPFNNIAANHEQFSDLYGAL